MRLVHAHLLPFCLAGRLGLISRGEEALGPLVSGTSGRSYCYGGWHCELTNGPVHVTDMVVGRKLVRFDRDVRAVMGPLSVLKNCTKREYAKGCPLGIPVAYWVFIRYKVFSSRCSDT